MADETAAPTPAARKRSPQVRFIDNAGVEAPMPEATGIAIGTWTWLLPVDGAAKLFALAGMAALALPIAKKWDTIGASFDGALTQRFAAVTPNAWGDEKPKRQRPDPEAKKAAALAELVDVVRSCKQAAGLGFDEAAVRAKLVDPAFARKVRKEPHIAAEIARRAGTQTQPDTLAGL